MSSWIGDRFSFLKTFSTSAGGLYDVNLQLATPGLTYACVCGAPQHGLPCYSEIEIVLHSLSIARKTLSSRQAQQQPCRRGPFSRVGLGSSPCSRHGRIKRLLHSDVDGTPSVNQHRFVGPDLVFSAHALAPAKYNILQTASSRSLSFMDCFEIHSPNPQLFSLSLLSCRSNPFVHNSEKVTNLLFYAPSAGFLFFLQILSHAKSMSAVMVILRHSFVREASCRLG